MAINIISNAIPNRDVSTDLQKQVNSSIDLRSPLLIRGGNSKAFYGREPIETSNILDMRHHTGIIDYEPAELALTLRAGTRLQDLEKLLSDHNQMLPFEPPMFGRESTIGGVVAAGIAGPRRPFSGSIRDSILGVEVLNGQGKIVQFGGRVMKNVAGYDLSRLMVRSMGTLGVILSVSLRLLPKPQKEMTFVLAASQEESLSYCKQWRRFHLPISATSWYQEKLYVRFSGTERSLIAAGEKFAAAHQVALLEEGAVFWQSIGNQSHPFFTTMDKPLWRLSLPSSAGVIARFEGELLTEWGGTQRWICNNAPANIIRSVAQKHGGYATLFKGRALLPEVPPFPELQPELFLLHQNLKRKLDPSNVFNPGRLYRNL